MEALSSGFLALLVLSRVPMAAKPAEGATFQQRLYSDLVHEAHKFVLYRSLEGYKVEQSVSIARLRSLATLLDRLRLRPDDIDKLH